jgi:hypothetical protein
MAKTSNIRFLASLERKDRIFKQFAQFMDTRSKDGEHKKAIIANCRPDHDARCGGRCVRGSTVSLFENMPWRAGFQNRGNDGSLAQPAASSP